ncbi:MAG TPA: hypothetical protein VMT69_13355 [Kineosporiaceae bacterium]|nr:hypothetical protein [Kineosporiaceae bacterium]
MNGSRIGILVAAVVAGPPLWSLVQSGELDAESALLRGGLVAVACAVAWSWIAKLGRDYAAEARRRQRQALLAQARQALGSATDGVGTGADTRPRG